MLDWLGHLRSNIHYFLFDFLLVSQLGRRRSSMIPGFYCFYFGVRLSLLLILFVPGI